MALPHKSSEVSDMFDIEPRTLFVYESENLIAPERTPTQRRRYSRRDIERILQIPETEFPELAGDRQLWA